MDSIWFPEVVSVLMKVTRNSTRGLIRLRPSIGFVGDRSIRMFDTHTGSCLWNVTVNDPAADTQGGNDTGITCVTRKSPSVPASF